MLSARAPRPIAPRSRALTRGVGVGARALPSPLAFAAARLTRGLARLPQLAALEPLHDGRRMLVAQAIEDRQDLLGVVCAKGRRLIVDDDRPVRVARRHKVIVSVRGCDVRGCQGAGAGVLRCLMELIVASIVELRSQIAHLFEETVGGALDRGDSATAEPYRFACGLSGGSTALIFLGALREAAVPWSQITLYWGDERAVPPDHPDSNYGLAERLLLSPLGARAPHAVRMRGELPDLEAAAADYDHAMPPALDLLILGTGEDGHVCSLFPGHKALMIEDHRVIAIDDAPKPPPRRLTLSLPYVCLSRRVWIVAVGPRKLPILQAAVSGHTLATPLDIVVRRAREVTVFTDQSIRKGFVPV